MVWTLKSAVAPTGGTTGGDRATLVYTDGGDPEDTKTATHYRTEGDSDITWQTLMKQEIAADLGDLNKTPPSTSDIKTKVDPG